MRKRRRRIGVDSSVLVAAMHANHPLYAAAAMWVAKHVACDDLSVTYRTIVECYAVLTRLPGQWRVRGDEAKRVIDVTVRQHMALAGFEAASVWDILEELAERYVTGGRSYEGLCAHILQGSGIQALATSNVAHFRHVAPELAIIDPASPDDLGM